MSLSQFDEQIANARNEFNQATNELVDETTMFVNNLYIFIREWESEEIEDFISEDIPIIFGMLKQPIRTLIANHLRWMTKQKTLSLDKIDMQSNEECSICQETYECDQKGCITECKHKFHFKCLETWIKQQQQCPLCRAKIPTKIIDCQIRKSN